MYTISETPSRYDDLVNILPKTRYVHTESPSRHIKNADRPQRGAPGLQVFESSELHLLQQMQRLQRNQKSKSVVIGPLFDPFVIGCKMFGLAYLSSMEISSRGN